MRASDYVQLARMYYPSEPLYDDPLFLAMLNDARNEVLRYGGVDKEITFSPVNVPQIYNLPLHQSLNGVYYYSHLAGKEFHLPRLFSKHVYRSYRAMPYGYFYDSANHTIMLVPEDARFPERDQVRVSYIPFAEPFTSWSDVELSLPEHLHQLVPIAYAIRLAMFDMQYRIADTLRQLFMYSLRGIGHGG